MEAKHTAGPWELRPDDMGGLSPFIYPVGSEYPVAVVTGYHSSASQRLPSARLIAAAPELLEALQSLLKSFPTEDDMHIAGWEQSEIDSACRDYAAARAAVAKATQ